MATPGETLYRWLSERYRPRGTAEPAWVAAIADDFEVPGLTDLLFESTIFMLLRRLLSNIAWYERRAAENGDNYEERYRTDYLHYGLRFSRDEARQLGRLVFQAFAAAKSDITDGLRARLRTKHQELGSPCALCGREIDYAAGPNDQARFSLDHIWPLSLGGTSDESNLRPTCAACNSSRQNMLAEADVHYEHFHLTTQEGHEHFLTELRRDFRIAVFLRGGLRCESCDTPVQRSQLFVGPRSRSESINMFNSVSLCDECRR